MSDQQTKTVISIEKPAPKWATWAFRIVFLLSTAATLIMSGDDAIPDEIKVRVGVYLSVLNTIMWSLGRMLGIEKEDITK